MMRYALLLLLYACLLSPAQAQTADPDSLASVTPAQYAIARYDRTYSDNEQLASGSEYIGYDRRLRVHPYFGSDSLISGRVQYRGKTFLVPMRYDLVSDVVVIQHTTGHGIILQSDKIRSFSLLGHTYIRPADTSSRDLRPGFYDLLYTGPTQLLARRTKTVLLNPAAPGGYGQFDSTTTFYVRKNGRYQAVKNKKRLLEVLGDRKKQLVAYARKQKLRFRPDPEPAILRLTQQYDALNNPL